MIAALGGAANLVTIDACTTRLRLIVRDQTAIDEAALKRLGARGIIRPSADALQVIVGPTADSLARSLREAAAGTGYAASLLAALGGAANVAAMRAVSSRIIVSIRDEGQVDAAAVASAGRGAVRTGIGTWHVIIGSNAPAIVREAGFGIS